MKRHFFLVFLLMAPFLSCGAKSSTTSEDSPICGDGVASDDEICDGLDLKNNSCASLNSGFKAGVLRCNPTCDGWNTIDCQNEEGPPVSNTCEPVEDGFCGATGKGTCFYIDSKNGNDSNPGSFSKPWKTTKNLSTDLEWELPSSWVGLHPGDVVYFMEGTHSEVLLGFDESYGKTLFHLQHVDGTATDPITIRNYPGHHAIIDTASRGMGLFIYQCSFINVIGLDIRNARYRGISINDSSNITVSQTSVSKTDGWVGDNVSGIEIMLSKDIVLKDSIIYDNYDRNAAFEDNQTENSCNIVLFRNSGSISIVDNVIYQTNDFNSAYSGCGVKYKHSSVDKKSQFVLSRNYFENHKFTAIGISTLNATITHNIVNGVGNNTVWGVGHAVDSRDWGGLTHQQNQIVEYNTFYADRAFFFLPTLENVDGENGPWNDLHGNSFKNNIVYETEIIGNEPPIEIYSAITDALYEKMLSGISFESNCYFNPQGNITFGFAESQEFGRMGGRYTLKEWQSTYNWDVDSQEIDPGFGGIENLDFTPTAIECANRGALADGVVVKTRKVFSIPCDG